MSSRIAQLAARLDALSRTSIHYGDILRITRWGNELAIPLPVTVVAALGLREGEEVDVRTLDPRTLTIAIRRHDIATS